MGFGDMMLLKYVICSIYTLYCYENRQNLMKNTYKSHDIVIVCLLASYFIRSNVSLSLLCTEQNVVIGRDRVGYEANYLPLSHKSDRGRENILLEAANTYQIV